MDDPINPNPYKTLNVPKDATLATIRSAHRKLVLLTHPDKVQDETAKKIKGEQFHLVQQAYEILSDETRRRRYDAKVKLAELREERADMMDERPPPRRSNEYSPKTTHPPVFSEVRNGREYVEVKPRTTRYEEERDPFSRGFASGEFVSRSDERRYDDRYGEPIPRKTSGRGPDERKKYRNPEGEYEYDLYKEKESRVREAKARDEYARKQSRRKKDEETKRDRETKSRDKFQQAYVDEYESESEKDRYYSNAKGDPKSRRKAEHSRKSSHEEPPRRGSKAKDNDETNFMDDRISSAQEYMSKSRETIDMENSRPRRSRTSSNVNRNPPPPPPQPPRPSDSNRKSSRRSPVERDPSPLRKSGKDKRVTEIVDPPSSRKPSMPAGKSDPKGLKIPEPKGLKGLFGTSRKEQESSRKDPQRASTTYQSTESKPASADFRKPGMRRAETMPMNQTRRSDAAPARPSQLRNSKAPLTDSSSDSSGDSDSDSDLTPEPKPARPSPPRHSATRYKVSQDKTQTLPTVFHAEPEDFRSSRKPSPKAARRSSERPMPIRGATTRTPTTPRATSFQTEDRPLPRQKLSRADTERPSPSQHHPGQSTLFGALDNEDIPPSPRFSPMDGLRNANKPYSRRGSEDVNSEGYPYQRSQHHRERSRAVYA